MECEVGRFSLKRKEKKKVHHHSCVARTKDYDLLLYANLEIKLNRPLKPIKIRSGSHHTFLPQPPVHPSVFFFSFHICNRCHTLIFRSSVIWYQSVFILSYSHAHAHILNYSLYSRLDQKTGRHIFESECEYVRIRVCMCVYVCVLVGFVWLFMTICMDE